MLRRIEHALEQVLQKIPQCCQNVAMPSAINHTKYLSILVSIYKIQYNGRIGVSIIVYTLSAVLVVFGAVVVFVVVVVGGVGGGDDTCVDAVVRSFVGVTNRLFLFLVLLKVLVIVFIL